MSEGSWKNPVPGAKWVRTWRLGEWLADPVSPLFETLVIPILATAREKGGVRHLDWKLPRGWGLREPWFCVVNGYFFARADFGLLSFSRFLLLDVPRIERALARWRRVNLPQYQERLQRLRAFCLEDATPTQLLDHIEGLCRDAAAWWHLISLDAGGASFMEHVFVSIYPRLLRDGPSPVKLLRGLDSPVMAGEQRLYALASQARDYPEIQHALELEDPKRVLTSLEASPAGRTFLSSLDSYLGEYGHQVLSLDLLFPTPQEDPGSLVPLLRKMVTGEISDPSVRVVEMVAQRERAEDELIQKLAQASIRRRILTGLLKRCQVLARRREATIFSFQQGWPLLRRAVLELGHRLTAKGDLSQASDVFFLTKDELWEATQALESGHLVDRPHMKVQTGERRERWEWQRTLFPPDRIPPADDPIWKRHLGPVFWGEGRYDRTGDRERLIGQAASPGNARGSARVLCSPADFERLRKGDVLVAATTSPAWTPLFGLAAAIVTETGGITSHASIVAREYGIPAVVATGCATQVIQEGQVVEVDGDEGIVYL